VIFDRPAVPLILPQFLGRNPHQPAHIGHHLVRQLVPARREPSVQRVEPQQQGGTELRRTSPARQLRQFITDQIQFPTSSSSSSTQGIRLSHEAGGLHATTNPTNRINTGRNRSVTSREHRKIPWIVRRPALTWANAIPCTG
jgi:hypothetical protein